MGRARFDHDSYVAYATASLMGADGTRKSLHDTFTQRQTLREFNPLNITVRESRDSDENPESRAIIFGLDVTGSMGHIAHEMANEIIPNLMRSIIDIQTVKDPHIMCMAVGDFRAHDHSPIQVSQFEADVKIVEQLQNFHVEGGGGGNDHESYDLPWYFAANYTSIDCYEKRGIKGYLFTIGDEPPPGDRDAITPDQFKSVFSKDENIGQPITPAQMLAMAQEKYDVFHIVVEQGNYLRIGNRREALLKKWRDLLGNRVILLDDYTNLAQVVQAVIAVNEGMNPHEVLEAAQSDNIRTSIRHALGLDTQ